MANLNLSQFGENTSVSNADYTFVWDSANAISKKVSRNSWLNSGTLTSDAPVTISQTWGTTGTYTAFKVVANETAVANTLSNVLELWSGNAATLKLSIRKSGQIVGPSGTIAAPTYGFADTDWGTGFSGWYRLGTGVACSTAGGTISAFSITHTNIRIGSSIPFGWTSGTAENALDTILLRDGAANTLALRNGAAAQTFNVYGTSSASNANYARLALTCGLDGNATISTQALGTGTAGTVSINGVPVGMGKGNVASNVAVGTGALNANTSGSLNIAIGSNSLLRNTTGAVNVSVGGDALANNGVGNSNVAIGYAAVVGNFAGCNISNNIGIGVRAITSTNSNDSVAIGYESLMSAATCTHNIALGTYSGKHYTGGIQSNVSCTNSVFIGGLTKAAASGETNQIVIGYDATGIGSNSVVLGNDSITKTALKGNVGIGTTAPTAPLHVQATAAATTRESILKCTVSDSGNDAFEIFNGTSADARFAPAFAGANFSNSSNVCLGFVGQTIASNDTGTAPIVTFAARVTASQTNPNNSTYTDIANRPLFAWYNLATPVMQMAANGNLGIGTTSPTSKLHVVGSSPGLTVENNIATGYSEVLFKNTASTGSSIFLNGSIQTGYGGASSLNIYSSTGPLAFHTASVTNALSIAQNGLATFSGNIVASSFYPGGILGLSHNGGAVTLGTGGWSTQHNGTRFTFSGLTDAFPAIERDGAGLKFTGAAAGSTSWIKVPPVAVSALPLAATAGAGARAFVNDASSPTFGSAVTGGGSIPVPVYSTGSAWHVG